MIVLVIFFKHEFFKILQKYFKQNIKLLKFLQKHQIRISIIKKSCKFCTPTNKQTNLVKAQIILKSFFKRFGLRLKVDLIITFLSSPDVSRWALSFTDKLSKLNNNSNVKRQ